MTRRRMAILSSVAAPFVPTDISGLRVWLDASDSSTINGGSFSDGDSVSTWTDKSSNAYSFTAAGGLRPIVKTNQQNGKAIIRSSASCITASVGADMTACSIFMVTKPTTLRQFDALISANNTFSTGGMTLEIGALGAGSTANFDIWDTNVGAKMPTGLIVTANTWFILNPVYSQATPLGTFYVANSSTNTTTQASMFLESTMALFDDNSPGFTAYRGDTAEILIYTSVLSTTDRTSVYDYLKAKWGL